MGKYNGKVTVLYETNEITGEKLIKGFEVYGKVFLCKKSNTLEEYKENVAKCYNKAAKKVSKKYNADLDAMYTKENITIKKVTDVDIAPYKLKNKIKKIAPVAVAATMALTTIPTGIADAVLGKIAPTVTKVSAENEADNKDNIQNKSVEELLSMLKTDKRQKAITKIVNTQDYFNETAALSIKKDNNDPAQLYFNFDEAVAGYIYANAMNMNTNDLSKIFGKSKIMCPNPAIDNYEKLTDDVLAAKYTVFCQILSYYYTMGATSTSGVSQLFENEQEAEIFNNFESLVLEYNRNKSSDIANKIRNELENIYMSGNIDAYINIYPGASSIISTAIVPYLYLEGIISQKTYDSIIEIGEKITCQDIYNHIKEMILELKPHNQEYIIERIKDLQNKKLRGLNRNVSRENSLEGYSLNDLDGAVLGSVSGFANSKTNKRSLVTTSRNKAIASSSLQAIQQAENKVNQELNNKNQAENDYWNAYQKYYELAYDDVFYNGGTGNISIPSNLSGKAKEGAIDGVARGKAEALQDRKTANDKIENDRNNGSSSNGSSNSPTNPSVPEEPATPIDPEPIPEPSTESTIDSNLKETWVYETQSTTAPTETKQIIQIERDGVTYETEAVPTASKSRSYGAIV